MAILGKNAIGLGGFGDLELSRALTNEAYLETHARLLGGQVLYRLQTTNASLTEFAVALSYYANKEVRALVAVQEESDTRRFGPFDSSAYSTRWAAASAIEGRLTNNGWHVLKVKDDKLLFISDLDRQALLTGQEQVELPPTPPSLPERVTQQNSAAVPKSDYE